MQIICLHISNDFVITKISVVYEIQTESSVSHTLKTKIQFLRESNKISYDVFTFALTRQDDAGNF